MKNENPPIKMSNGSIVYVKRGGLHNDIGPAIIFPDGSFCFYLNNEPMDFDTWRSNVNWDRFSEREQTFLSLKFSKYMVEE